MATAGRRPLSCQDAQGGHQARAEAKAVLLGAEGGNGSEKAFGHKSLWRRGRMGGGRVLTRPPPWVAPPFDGAPNAAASG